MVEDEIVVSSLFLRAVEEDHIVALGTAPGKAAIALIRLSGANSKALASKLFKPYSASALVPRSAALGRIQSESGEVVDQVLMTWFPAPESYTGEDVVEVSCHGSLLIAGKIVELLVLAGARLAEPGEFTKRAFLNGKLDLAQAEAVRDLIESQTMFQARLAAEQLGGSVSRLLEPMRSTLVDILSQMETALEFVEDEVETENSARQLRRLDKLNKKLLSLETGFEFGKRVRGGMAVVIVGPPNAGKSSIFNALLRSERALVAAVPGTTRDAVSEVIDIEGLPVRLIDTAGIRKAKDSIEELGIEKTLESLGNADIVLFVLDRTQLFGPEEWEVWELIREKAAILILNKKDLSCQLRLPAELESLGLQMVATSALTGEGLEEVVAAIWREMNPLPAIDRDNFFLTSIRHYEAIVNTRKWLCRGIETYREGWSEEFPIHDFRKALGALGMITGDTSAEDILDQIFSTFCIGK